MARERGLARTEPRAIQQVEPWDSFANMERMMRNFFLSPFPSFRPLDKWLGVMPQTFMPEVDLSEAENEFVLSASIPGMTKDNINIDVTADRISISGERKSEQEETPDKTYHVRQQSYGSFSVSYMLPSEIKPDDVKATYKDGMLHVDMPKAEAAKRHRVKVQAEQK